MGSFIKEVYSALYFLGIFAGLHCILSIKYIMLFILTKYYEKWEILLLMRSARESW